MRQTGTGAVCLYTASSQSNPIHAAPAWLRVGNQDAWDSGVPLCSDTDLIVTWGLESTE